MAIAINGSGTITGISVGGIPDGTVDTDVLAANAVTYAKIGNTEQGQLCKAWVNFNGTGTVAIRASYNVSSITDNGLGDYTVNFTTAMADASFAANVTVHRGSRVITHVDQILAITASTYRFTVSDTSNSAVVGVSVTDTTYAMVSIFR